MCPKRAAWGHTGAPRDPLAHPAPLLPGAPRCPRGPTMLNSFTDCHLYTPYLMEVVTKYPYVNVENRFRHTIQGTAFNG